MDADEAKKQFILIAKPLLGKWWPGWIKGPSKWVKFLPKNL
jgi:hypothetical protein